MGGEGVNVSVRLGSGPGGKLGSMDVDMEGEQGGQRRGNPCQPSELCGRQVGLKAWCVKRFGRTA